MDWQLVEILAETGIVAVLSAAATYFAYRIYDAYKDKTAAIGWLAVTISLIIMLVRRMFSFYAAFAPSSELAMLFDSYDWLILCAISLTQIYAFWKVKSLLEELELEKRKVEALSKSKENLMDAFAHELKTPLSVVLSSLYVLRKMEPQERKKDWKNALELAERNSVRLRHSVDQILAVKEIEGLELTAEAVDLRSVVDDICAEYVPLAHTKGLEVRVSLCEARVKGNRGFLRTALSNFVSNAVKFTERGAIRISLSRSDGGYAFTVRDTGMGISEKDRRRLFVKFFKADLDAPGNGMGLWLAAEIIKKYGGKATVESRPGKGSTFTVWLPAGG